MDAKANAVQNILSGAIEATASLADSQRRYGGSCHSLASEAASTDGTRLPDGKNQILRLYVFGPSGLKDYGSAMLRYEICNLSTLRTKEEQDPAAEAARGRGEGHELAAAAVAVRAVDAGHEARELAGADSLCLQEEGPSAHEKKKLIFQ